MGLEIWKQQPKQQNIQEYSVKIARSDSEWYKCVLLVPRAFKETE